MGETLFDHTYIDYVGPIKPPSQGGNHYIFTAECDLTKFLVAVPAVDKSALTAAKCLLEHVICRYNFPSRLISDNAKEFTSKIIKELTHLFSIKKIFTTPYHPQSNKVERAHRSLNAYLRSFSDKNKTHWDELLKYATFVYNNTVHTTTGFTPHELAHGFKIQIPSHLTRHKTNYDYENLATIVRNNIADSLEIAKEQLHAKKLKNKEYYDQKTKPSDISVGDKVLIRSTKKGHKFDPLYYGPFLVTKVLESHIEYQKGNKIQKIHKNLTKLVRSNDTTVRMVDGHTTLWNSNLFHERS